MKCVTIGMLVNALACAVTLSLPVVAQDVEPSERSMIARRLDEIRIIGDSPRRLSLLSMVLSNWSESDLVGMYSYIASVDDWDLSRPGIQGPEGLRINRTVNFRNTDAHELAALNGQVPPPFDVGFRRDVVGAVILSGSMAPDDFGAALLALPETEGREQALVSMVDQWAVREPVRAVEWLIANSDVTSASPQAYRRAGGRLTDSDIAEQYIDRVPASARAIWIQTIANHIGTEDPARAADWIATYRDEPAYRPTMSDIAFYMASRDGPRAAGLLREAALEDDPAAVLRVARLWASQYPQATIDWLRALPDDATRTAGLGGVGRVWSRRDPQAAEAWVLGLPKGEQRNAILYAMIEIAVILGDFGVESSAVLFDAYSDDAARQIASATIARELADRNQEASANYLLDRYVTDVELRWQYRNGEPLRPPE